MLHELYQQQLPHKSGDRQWHCAFLQGRFRPHRVPEDRFIIAEDTGRYTHHPELVTQHFDLLDRCLHGDELRAKGTGLYCILSLVIPDHRHAYVQQGSFCPCRI